MNENKTVVQPAQWRVEDKSFALGDTGDYGTQALITDGNIQLWNYQESVEFEKLESIAANLNALNTSREQIERLKEENARCVDLIESQNKIRSQLYTLVDKYHTQMVELSEAKQTLLQAYNELQAENAALKEQQSKPTIVYEALYNPCIHESGYITISVHATKKGAYNAMRKHLLNTWDEFRENESFGRRGKNKSIIRTRFKFGIHQDWAVSSKELEN